MKRGIIVICMAAVAALFGIQLAMEHLFLERRLAQTMAASERRTVTQMQSTPQEPPEPSLIALFGIDGAKGQGRRSDCVMLASLDDTGKICLASIARDTRIRIPENGEKTKLCHAYAYGGAELAVKTLEENFGLSIDNYISVDFDGLMEITDQLGGIEVKLTQAEWKALGLPEPYLGQKRLSGQETLSYCRLRSLDNDFFRMERQRKVMEALLQAFLTGQEEAMPASAIACFGHCRSDLTLPDILRLVSCGMKNRTQLSVDTLSIPGDTVPAEEGIQGDGVWYYCYDLNIAGAAIRDFFGISEDAS